MQSDTYISYEDFQWHIERMTNSPILFVDTEGTLNHPFSETWGLSYSVDNIGEYFGFNHHVTSRETRNLPSTWLPQLAKTVENHSCLVMHNAKHDLRALRSLGIEYKGKFYCTMMMAHWTNENSYSKGLDAVSKAYGGPGKEEHPAMKHIIDGFGWHMIPLDMMRKYATIDATTLEQLFYPLMDEFTYQEFDTDTWEVEQEFIRLMSNIEDHGVLIDKELCQLELDNGLQVMDKIKHELGFNVGSPVQLGNYLLNVLKLPPVGEKSKAGRFSFDKENMEVYDEMLTARGSKEAQQILTYRGWAKTTSSNYKPYLDLVGPDGRLRPNFKLHGTKTGRMSCEKPNLQQIPRQSEKSWNGLLKQAFIVERGRKAWDFDYAQLELRLGAAYAKEPRLLEIFSDRDRDIFSEMASDLGMLRQDCKTLNYTLMYGGGIDRISTVFGVGRLAAKAIRDNYYSKYPGLARAARIASNRIHEQGYVKYWTGRRRHLNKNEDYKAFNSAIQGGAFEIVKRQMLKLDKEGLNNKDCAIDLQVHDSIRVDIVKGKEKEYTPEILRVLENAPDFGVKFKVDCKEWPVAA